MLIASKEHDYYDSIMQLGVDKTCVFTRKMLEWFDNESEYKRIFSIKPRIDMKYVITRMDRFRNPIGNIRIEKTGYIFFCGSCFPFLDLSDVDRTGVKHSLFAFSPEEVDRFVYSFGAKEDKIGYDTKSKRHSINFWNTPLTLRQENIQLVFSNRANKTDDIIDFHHKIDSPIVVFDFFYRNHKITINPLLKNYEFYKVFDPYTTFQELSMFISGVMGGKTPKMEKVSDEVRLEKHGFDKKTSFRMEKKNERLEK